MLNKRIIHFYLKNLYFNILQIATLADAIHFMQRFYPNEPYRAVHVIDLTDSDIANIENAVNAGSDEDDITWMEGDEFPMPKKNI